MDVTLAAVSWSKDISTFGKTRQVATTADVYGVSESAFLQAFHHAYQDDYSELNKIPELIHFYPRKYPKSKSGFNLPAAFHELQKMTDANIDLCFIWTLLAFRYHISLEDISDVIYTMNFEKISPLLLQGHSLKVAVAVITNDIDSMIVANFQ